MVKIALAFSCSGLSNLDGSGKSDPSVVAILRNYTAEEWKEVGQTEVVRESLNPEFLTPITIDFKFEVPQTIRFYVYDVDHADSSHPTKELIGGTEEILVGDILRAKGRTWQGQISRENKTQGTVKCVADELSSTVGEISLQFAASKLDSKDTFSKSDPFLILERGRDDGTWVPVHKTEFIDDDSNPVWKKFTLPISTLCFSKGSPIRISCFDDDGLGMSELIGRCTTTLEQLISRKKDMNWALVDPKKSSNEGIAGTLKLLQVDYKAPYTFIDYLTGGCELSLITAIDYTASNGPIHDLASLHRIAAGVANPYEVAIQAVGNILASYDSDGQFQVMGFGAKINNEVNFCFGLTGSEGAKGISGILAEYRKFTATAVLWGPTNFAPCIRSAMTIASQYQTQQNQKYFVLLIVTDGAITDLDETKNAIIEASRLPLSIVIVGVGPADFSAMNALDSDKGALSHNGQQAARDIVQFVPIRDHLNSPEQLAAVTLAEIPAQIVSFFQFAGFVPNPPRHFK
eukprot:c6181_g1_i1.p1 GENE.c6181_g1_i1~~c6181_g1_i1.p1  ORF type:complete len:517 (+),score=140.89 c6181_g1_i1:69-1619(+)